MNKFVKLSLSYYKLGTKCWLRGMKHYIYGRYFDIVHHDMDKSCKQYELSYAYGVLADFSLEMAQSLIDLAD